MTYSSLKLIGVAFVAFGLGACGHSGHQPMSGMAQGKPGCMMMSQGAKGGMPMGDGNQGSMPMGEGQTGKNNGMMAQNGCPMMAGKVQAPAPKPEDEHAEHHK